MSKRLKKKDCAAILRSGIGIESYEVRIPKALCGNVWFRTNEAAETYRKVYVAPDAKLDPRIEELPWAEGCDPLREAAQALIDEMQNTPWVNAVDALRDALAVTHE